MSESQTRSLDTTRLREVTGAAQNRAESKEVTIHTRAQQRLAADDERATELDGQIAQDEDYALRLRSQLVEMQRLLTQTEENIRNAKIERQACLESGHYLRSAGIAL